MRAVRHGQRGQALVLLLATLVAVVVAAAVLGAIAQGLLSRGGAQAAADLAALAGARALGEAHARVFLPATLDGRPNAEHLDRAAYLDRGRRAALATATRNGADAVRVGFPGGDGDPAPVRIRVEVGDPIPVGAEEVPSTVVAEAELVPAPLEAWGASAGTGEYRGPFATRQGRRMRPDVALGFDRLAAAARAAGHALVIASAFRSDAEQAVLFAARPDPRWVAPPGTSLHRLGTELDLGPPSAYAWLAANAERHGFRKRYAWEPWHFGWIRGAGTRSVGYGPARGRSGVPSFVPARYAQAISRAAQRWNVAAAVLAAQLQVESGFDPAARSPAGAQGIAQFMPATARRYGLRDPFDAAAAIDAQGRLMRDLLRRFASVPLALAAYNAGPRPVAACGCVPPYPETRAYVARVLGLLGGAGDPPPGGGVVVRLVR